MKQEIETAAETKYISKKEFSMWLITSVIATFVATAALCYGLLWAKNKWFVEKKTSVVLSYLSETQAKSLDNLCASYFRGKERAACDAKFQLILDGAKPVERREYIVDANGQELETYYLKPEAPKTQEVTQ